MARVERIDILVLKRNSKIQIKRYKKYMRFSKFKRNLYYLNIKSSEYEKGAKRHGIQNLRCLLLGP